MSMSKMFPYPSGGDDPDQPEKKQEKVKRTCGKGPIPKVKMQAKKLAKRGAVFTAEEEKILDKVRRVENSEKSRVSKRVARAGGTLKRMLEDMEMLRGLLEVDGRRNVRSLSGLPMEQLEEIGNGILGGMRTIGCFDPDHGCMWVPEICHKNSSDYNMTGKIKISTGPTRPITVQVFELLCYLETGMTKEAYAEANGIPTSKVDVSHLCHLSCCCNPAHIIFEPSANNQRRRECNSQGLCDCGFLPKCIINCHPRPMAKPLAMLRGYPVSTPFPTIDEALKYYPCITPRHLELLHLVSSETVGPIQQIDPIEEEEDVPCAQRVDSAIPEGKEEIEE
eukprot:TRINITY_DN3125_c0_g1_i1.p1 TRINITY_DN3125_c0_g1~~TRINITY_DN3125_c0_g1_i1.p1  ORF type:complete len:336 (+),score=39.90 TRINITY_DN3125_c0_g1_i1:70-1077(+)